MPSVDTDLATRVQQLEAALEAIDARLAKLEHRRAHAAPTQPAAKEAASQENDIALAGVAVLILGGAYVLRALTESAVLPPLGGAAAGLAYAAVWIWNADRLARRGRGRAAVFQIATAAMIAYPLLWEATARFRVLAPSVAAALMALFAAGILFVAARGNRQSVLWIGNAGAVVAAFAIAKNMQAPLPMLIGISVIGAATMLVAFARSWPFAPWLPAAGANILALIFIAAVALHQVSAAPAIIAAGLGAFALLWILPAAWRKEVTLFEIGQTANVLLFGIGGAAVFAANLSIVVGGVCLGAAVLCYAASARRLTAYFTSAGAYLAALATLLIAPSITPFLWGAAGLASAEAERRSGRRFFAVQSALWLMAATMASVVPALQLSTGSIVVALLAVIAFARVRFLRIVPLAIFVSVTLAGTMTVLPHTALSRTAVLAIGAALLAFVGRLLRVNDAVIIARVLLVIGGLKLIAEDVRVGPAAILVVAFALYGGAMLVVAKNSLGSRTA